jgi:hypothetical protein
LDPNTLPDGPVEVRAKVIPLGEGMLVREPAPLTLYANGRGSLTFGKPVWVDCDRGDDAADATEARPLKSLAAAIKQAPDGGTIYLKSGKGYSAHALEGGLSNRYVPYVTGGLTTEMDNGPGGVLMRGHQIVKITSDAFTDVQTAINCSVEDIDPGQTGAHPDFHQSYVGDPNAFNTVILYNVWRIP